MLKLRTLLVASGSLAALAGCSDNAKMQPSIGAPTMPAPTASAGSGAPQTAAGSVASSPAMPGVPPTAAPASPKPAMPMPAMPGTPPASGAGSMNTPPMQGDAKPAVDPKMPLSMIPANCKGFEVAGLKESPGGTKLPNTCAPFDGLLNNPYAIRCIDADPNYQTKYPGDEYCILPPPANLGTQIHIGPADASKAGQFELAAGDEISNFFYINTSNAEPRYYFRANWRMRPGGHHLLVSMLDQDAADGWQNFGDMGSDFGGRGKSFGGSQRVSVDRPQAVLDIPPENTGIGQQLAARQQFAFNLHSINAGTATALREVWVNVWYVDDAAVMKPIQTFAGTGNPADMSIAPGKSVQLEYACSVSAETRLITMYGHYHAHNVRFGAWVVKQGGQKISIYESFDWEDIPVYQFDSVSMNPMPDVAKKIDGATSGTLTLVAGDQLHFQCDINNDSSTALRFADEAVTGEMCILFGTYTGANPCSRVQRVQ